MFTLFMAMPSEPPVKPGSKEEDCIARIAKGDSTALARLYELTHAAVYGFALSVVLDQHDAEDVLQDTYIQIWNGASGYHPRGKPLAWMFTIARNLALMRLREKKRTVVMEPQDWQSIFAKEPAVSHEDRLVLQTLLGTLSEKERQIVMLHAMSGLKHREIAGILGMGLPAVLSCYSRAVRKLQKAFKEQ